MTADWKQLLNTSSNLRGRMLRRIITSTVIATILFSGSFSRAQSPNATVTGTITDSSGGVVSGALVELTDTTTDVSTTDLTNDQGIYRINGLLPGTYRARISKMGFKSITKAGIVLHVQDDISLNFELQVGEVSQSITVEAGEPLLQSESSSLSQVIEGRTVQDTPLNGRNVMNLVALAPGVVAQGTTQGNPVANQGNGTFTNPNGWGNYQIGGGFANQSATYIDGAPINTSYVNSVSLVVTQDAIGEFRVASNSVTPEYGRFGGGVINMVTKSGGNQFHGGVYEYIRNKVLNANYYFNNAAGLPRPAFTQNQYGVTVGGPIKKDKAFFFFSWEGFGLRTANPQTLSVPTDAMKNGDLRALGANIYNPFTTVTSSAGVSTRTQYSCNGELNVICPNLIDPTARILLGYFPEPNLPGTSTNYAVDPSTGGNYNQYNARIDYALNQKQRLFGRYTYWKGSTLAANAFHNSTGVPGPDFTTHQAVLGDTYTINNTTVADFRLSYLRFLFNALPLSTGVDLSTFGPNYAALADSVSFRQNPIADIVGYNAGGYTSQDLTILNTTNNYVLSANVTKTLGKHSLTFGGEVRDIQWSYTQNNDGGGYFNFNNAFTAQYPNSANVTGGAGFASFLAGAASSGSLVNVNFTTALQWYYGFYLNDSYKISSRFSVNLGARWEQPGEFYERHNRLNVLLPDAVDPLSGATGLDLHGQVALVDTPLYKPRTERQLHWDLFSPRVGFVFRVLDNTVVRGGYGLSYLPNDVGFASGPWNSPVNSTTTNMAVSLDGGLTPYATLSNPFPSGLLTPIGNDASRLGELEGGAPGATIPYATDPYVQQWNLNLEQQFGPKTIVEIGYAGSRGTHLPLYLQQLNQLPDQYNSLDAALFNPVPNPFQGKVNSTSSLYSASTLPAGYLLKPYPQYLGFDAWAPYIGNSNYQSMQVKLQRQFGAGGNLLAAYTWAKLISDTDTLTAWLEASTPGGQYGSQDTYNRRADRSLSANDVRSNFVLSYVVDVPVGRGKRFLGDVGSVSNALVGGWSVNGVTNLRSGFPLTFGSALTNYLPDFGSGGIRPNVVPGCSKAIGGAANSRLNEYFNTNCFVAPGVFSFGDESRNDSQLRAPGIDNWDFGLFKTIPIKDRINAQFRAEFFNIANHPQFSPPGTTLGGYPMFGQIIGQANQPRLIQFSLRVSY